MDGFGAYLDYLGLVSTVEMYFLGVFFFFEFFFYSTTLGFSAPDVEICSPCPPPS